MTLQNRLKRLEGQTLAQPAKDRIPDEERMARMIDIAQQIASEAGKQGITAQDDPRLALPLVVAEVAK